jgi:hypothetical protein
MGMMESERGLLFEETKRKNKKKHTTRAREAPGAQ